MSTEAHASAAKTYGKVLGALIALTIITVLAAGVDFGAANVVIALAIATLKASLVALFFMHLLHEKAINAIIFVSGLIFLGVFLALTMLDVVVAREPIRPSIPARATAPAAAAPAQPAAGPAQPTAAPAQP
ncbi:MAG TPA: cytochrome C oxidase subunit IV family protein [Bryobacteraceae bacterium]|nr:cytochrome C oxidase subunit IV family protein [Bryobacteraceae bacterium]HOQ47212.1 cytochrome C oxidase subunit IV family protein [Bryobacteraceae bacterium]HPU74090.1 cytochrome C oxidase subunit IV family protein [Bryobacteraceae bacterium]